MSIKNFSKALLTSATILLVGAQANAQRVGEMNSRTSSPSAPKTLRCGASADRQVSTNASEASSDLPEPRENASGVRVR